MEFYMRRRKETYESQTAKLRIWKIAIYIRLSRDDGYDESLSVTNQRKIILEYLEKFFEDEYELVNIYIEMYLATLIQYAGIKLHKNMF